jgi:hypothetical protein
MLVADMEQGLMGSLGKDRVMAGTWSSNSLLVKVLAEHIHHDIYQFRMKGKTGVDPVSPDILLGSLLEGGGKTGDQPAP